MIRPSVPVQIRFVVKPGAELGNLVQQLFNAGEGPALLDIAAGEITILAEEWQDIHVEANLSAERVEISTPAYVFMENGRLPRNPQDKPVLPQVKGSVIALHYPRALAVTLQRIRGARGELPA